MMLTSLVMVSRNSHLSDTSLRLSKAIAQELNLTEGTVVDLVVGRLETRLKIGIVRRAGNIMQLSPAALNRLHLPSARRYAVKLEEQRLYVGPVVGIMHDIMYNANRPFGGQSFFIQELCIEGMKLGQLCFGFDPHRINYTEKTAVGYIYTNGSWRRGIFPLPDVIYPRNGGDSPAKIKLRNRLQAMGCIFINPPLIGKWQTYQILSVSPELSQYVPDTNRVNTFRQVDNMLRKYSSVYIKPINGSQGRDIIRVKRDRNSSYRYQYKVKYEAYSGYAPNRASLRQNLWRIMRHHQYIVQQNIDLLRVNGSICDVRVMVQKDDNGEWSVTGKAFRIGRKGSITSNISCGGSGSKMKGILRRRFHDVKTQERIINEVDYLAVEVAKALEKETGRIGELGIDIGIDNDGKLWLIEANLKPARRIFVLIGESDTRRMAVRKPLLYARHLAGFRIER